MMYMGTPRDYEFYVTTRVMLRLLRHLKDNTDLVVIASLDVPSRWVQSLQEEDGAKVVSVENIKNPYSEQSEFDWRFKLTLNKLYAWKLLQYDRVVMLDADNLFLHKADELFQCGQFCAVFINPCIFHTGLFVLQPSMAVFNDMIHELDIGRNLKLWWNVPYGPNSVITFPGASWLKPWYWWSWPVLPLGIDWHRKRLQTIGYGAEMPIVLIQVVFYLEIMAVARLARPNISKLFCRSEEKSVFLIQTGYRLMVDSCCLFSPNSLHSLHDSSSDRMEPLLSWIHFTLDCRGQCFLAPNAACSGAVARVLSSSFLYVAFMRIVSSLQVSLEREGFVPRLGESALPSGLSKLR
ncbi:hypothetical protein SASPL_120986 [Salvia splendens]|uniref:Hexosyltransferase n=1 Tax=Salvia splendens TaxID=180675 RepID=A0A8X8ZW56_SALSN|nr:hypothetical protein SASPL_120986 [Salvia splendens]